MSIALEAAEARVADESRSDEGRFEFLNGTYVEKAPMGASATYLTFLLMAKVLAHVQANHLGLCLPENCTYRIFPGDKRRSRIPDGSFIRAGRLPGDKPPQGDLVIPPDLAVEVISPTNTVIDMEERLDDLLGAGVQLLWVIVPQTRTAYVHRADGSVSRLKAGDVLSGEDIVPGFTLRLSELYEAV